MPGRYFVFNSSMHTSYLVGPWWQKRCAIPRDGYQRVLFGINKINGIWLCNLSGDEKLPGAGGVALAILSTAGLWFCVLGSKVINLVRRSDSWRMPRFLELGLVHLTVSTWIFMGLSLIYKTLKLVSTQYPVLEVILNRKGLSTAENLKCGGSGVWPCDCHGVPEVLCERHSTRHCLCHPRGAGPRVWPILTADVPDPQLVCAEEQLHGNRNISIWK